METARDSSCDGSTTPYVGLWTPRWQSVVKVPWKARRAPAVDRRGVRRMAIRVISSDERQSRRPQMSVAQRVTRRFRPTAQRVQRRVPRTTRRYFIGPRRVTPPA